MRNICHFFQNDTVASLNVVNENVDSVRESNMQDFVSLEVYNLLQIITLIELKYEIFVTFFQNDTVASPNFVNENVHSVQKSYMQDYVSLEV